MMALSVTPNESLELNGPQSPLSVNSGSGNRSQNAAKTEKSDKTSGENPFLSALKNKSKEAASPEDIQNVKSEKASHQEKAQKTESVEKASGKEKADKSSGTEKAEKTEKSDKIEKSDKTKSPSERTDEVSEVQSQEEIVQVAEEVAQEFAPAFVQTQVPEENEISMEIDVVEQTSSIEMPQGAEEIASEMKPAQIEGMEELQDAVEKAHVEGTAMEKMVEAVVVEPEETVPENAFEQAMAQVESDGTSKETAKTKISSKENKIQELPLSETGEEQIASQDVDAEENPFLDSLKAAGENIASKRDESVQEENPIKVVDLRTKNPEETSQPTELAQDTAPQVQHSESQETAVNFSANVQQNITASSDQSAQASGSTFQQMVNQQVERNIPDFVKAGSIVLRDNNQGSIKLNLKPEALGNVKFNLQISDNKITGEITVASKEALEAFKQNLEQLRQAFVQNGFENATLNLNLADNSGNYNQNGQQETNEKYRANKAYGEYGVAQGDAVESEPSGVYFDGSDYKVNVVA